MTEFSGLDGAPVTNQDDEKLGKVTGLFVDDQLQVPTWAAVTSGLFGSHHALVPLAESRVVGGELLVPYSKDDLASAPHHDPDVALTVADEQVLFDHYNVGYGTTDTNRPAHRRGHQRLWPGRGAHRCAPGRSCRRAPAAPAPSLHHVNLLT